MTSSLKKIIANSLSEFCLSDRFTFPIYNLIREISYGNNKINLTGIKDPLLIFEKLVKETFYLLPFIKKVNTILDLGCGSGILGLTVKIILPKTKVYFLDATLKKLLFIQQSCQKLKLKDTYIIHGRAEELAHNENYREFFDCVICRAVASLPVSLELSAPFVKIKGILFQYYSDIESGVLEKSKILGLALSEILKYGENRTLLIFKKINNTPSNYPRKFNKIKRNPLFML